MGLEGTLLPSSETPKADPGLNPEPRRGLSSRPSHPDPCAHICPGAGLPRRAQALRAIGGGQQLVATWRPR